MMKRLVLFVLCFLSLVALSTGCQKREAASVGVKKLRIVTTLFPLYDFARNVAGDRAEVSLLLPPGLEPHSFEPRPEDIVRVNKANLFIYTNRYMEPWAADIVKGVDSAKLGIVDASRGAKLLKAGKESEHDGEKEEKHHHEGGMDPHIWLDFANAQVMVDNIAEGLAVKDPANKEYYLANASAYKAKLADLDNRYREGLSGCAKRVFLHGGHFAFGYLANRYGLHYESAYAVNADSEPTPAKLASLVRQMRENGLKHVYAEELIDPRMAETISRETGATILMLHGAHNISKDDLARGVTFLSLMEQNLTNLRTGLQCR